MPITQDNTPSVRPFIFPSMKPKFIKRFIFNWTLDYLGYHIWAHPVIEKLISCTLLSKFCRYDTNRGYGRGWSTFTIPYSTKYPNACVWISANMNLLYLPKYYICTCISIYHQFKAYPSIFLNIMRKWYIMPLEFETKIFNLSASFYISFVSWR